MGFEVSLGTAYLLIPKDKTMKIYVIGALTLVLLLGCGEGSVPRDYTVGKNGSTCGDPDFSGKWVGKVYETQTEVICNVITFGRGTLTQLVQVITDEVTADVAIHEGPTAETYKELPSQYYDLTSKLITSQMDADVRYDVHFATDEENEFIHDSLSTEITGKGYAPYMKRLDKGFELRTTQSPGEYYLRLFNVTNMEKPPFVPTSAFMNKLQSSVEEKMEKSKKDLVAKVENNVSG